MAADYDTQIAVTLIDKASKEYEQVGAKLIDENKKMEASSKGVSKELKNEEAAARGAAKEVDNLGKKKGEASTKTNSLMSSVKGLVGAYVGMQGIRMATQFLSASVQEAVTAEQAYIRLGAVLKATGKNSEISADQVSKMAKELQGLTVFEDDAIVAGQALLLEFDRIGADTLPRATRAMLDLATRTGDMQGSALMLGKALQGEEGALIALRRSGIVFNDEQVKMIERLRENGKFADANAIIFEKLEGRIGGSAEAAGESASGELLQYQNRWKDIKEEIGKNALPMLNSVLGVMLNIAEVPIGKAAPFAKETGGSTMGISRRRETKSETEARVKGEAQQEAEVRKLAGLGMDLKPLKPAKGQKSADTLAAEKKLLDEKIARDLYNEEFETNSFNRLEKWKQDKRKDAADIEAKQKDDLLEADRKRTEEYYKLEEEKAKARTDGITQGVSDLETLAKANKRFGNLYKAGAITEAIIDGHKAFIKAFAWGNQWGGPILGGIAAATSAGATGARVNAIREQKFAQGGFVQGGSTSGDREWVRANAGEGIITTGQQRRLMDILDGRAGVGGGTVTYAPNITIYGATDAGATASAVGKTVQETLREHARMNRRLQTAMV